MARGISPTQFAHDLCHTYGHAWFEIDADKPPEFGFYSWLKCERCDTIRKDVVNHTGEIMSRSYAYPDGYLWSGDNGAERPSRNDYRLQLISLRLKNGRVRQWHR